MKPLTYLLVDFENGQPTAAEIALVRAAELRLWIFHGPHQNKFGADMVRAWQPLGEKVRFIQSSKAGKNALDFHIAFYLGVLHRENSTAARPARYVVVTGDGGFDAIFDHMQGLGSAVGKAASIPEALALAESLRPAAKDGEAAAVQPAPRPSRGIIPAHDPAKVKKAGGTSTTSLRKTLAANDTETVLTELRAHPRNRPADRKALERYIVARLGNKVTVQVSQAVIKELERQGVVSFKGAKIDYKVPKAKAPA